MVRETDVTRRRFLIAGTTVALAGCVGSNAGGGDTPTETTTEKTSTTTQGTETTEGNGDSGHQTESDHHGSHGSDLSGPSKHAEVAMATADGGSHFSPHVVWVKTGGSVTWKLDGGAHSTTAYHPNNDRPRRVPEGASSWDSGTLSNAGKTFEHTFETAGVYDYFCLPHEATGMIGSVIVGDPDPHGQAALEPPSDSLPSAARKKITSLNEQVTGALESGGHDH